MSGFIYNGQSTATILTDSSLMLASFETVEEVTGHERSSILGNYTISRPIANEYGTQYEKVSFEYTLMKQNLEPFDEDEQTTIETWLSSPKYDSDLQLIDCNGYVQNIYTGKFISTRWISTIGGWAGVTFTFECNSAYAHQHYTHSYTVEGSKTISIDCETDELEEYTYPVITLYTTSGANQIVITNNTDDENEMTVNLPNRLNVVIDCNHCILSDGTTAGIVSFEDIGWEEIGNIYWLRLSAGTNTIYVTGNCQITIEYDAVSKKVGGWL